MYRGEMQPAPCAPNAPYGVSAVNDIFRWAKSGVSAAYILHRSGRSSTATVVSGIVFVGAVPNYRGVQAGFSICSGYKREECMFDGLQAEDPRTFRPLLLIGGTANDMPPDIPRFNWT
jgi:hypothetical protein